MIEKTVNVNDSEQMSKLFGNCDTNITELQKKYNVGIVCRGDTVKIFGEEAAVNEAMKAVETLIEMSSRGRSINEQTVRYVANMVDDGLQSELKELDGDGICFTTSGKIIRPKTLGQQKYINAIKKNTIVLGIGPAGQLILMVYDAWHLTHK